MWSTDRRKRFDMSRRDPLIDLLRAGSLLVVVVWHWVFTTIRWTGSGPRVGNPVAVTPGMWLATWFLQIMPAFFMIGGFLHSTNRLPARAFWSKRLRRLVLPVLPLLVPAAVVSFLLWSTGRNDLLGGVLLVVSPMWFLATYVVCVLFAPLAQRLHRAMGSAAVFAGVLAVASVDLLRIGLGHGGVVTGALAFTTVWLTVHQLGYSMGAVLGGGRRRAARLAIAGYGMLGVAAALLPYPAAMVGLDGHELSNMGPPTVMVVFLAIGQLGLIGVLSRPLRSFADGHKRLLTTMGDWSMTVYAWHLVAYAAFWAVLVHRGFTVDHQPDLNWWTQRPLWLMGPAVFAVPICAVTRRFDTTSVEVERIQPHLFTDRQYRRVGQRPTLPVGPVHDERVPRDERRVG